MSDMEVKTQVSSQELAQRFTEEALIAQAKADLPSADELVVPRLKVAQGLTKEVAEGDARPGELIHSLTGESYGTAVEFIVVDAFKGRAWRDPEKQLRTANKGESVVPWEEHLCHGQAFVDCPDAEEQYRAAVRANEKDWGKGPGIATTYNFVGLVVGEDGVETFPVRLSLMRAAAKEGRNFMTMLNIARAPWDNVYEVSTQDARSKGGEPYKAVRIKQTRRTTNEEKQVAVSIAQLIHGGASVAYDEPPEEEGAGGFTARAEATEGGLEV